MSGNEELLNQISQAISAHGQWKNRLTSAISTGSSEFEVVTVAKDNQCAFGKWLYGGIAPNHKAHKHYENVRTLHATFHKEAAKVLELALNKNAADAKAAMGLVSPYAKASSELTKAMMAWQADAK